MRDLNVMEMGSIQGGNAPSVPPPVGVSQFEWDQLLRQLEEQKKRDAQQQN